MNFEGHGSFENNQNEHFKKKKTKKKLGPKKILGLKKKKKKKKNTLLSNMLWFLCHRASVLHTVYVLHRVKVFTASFRMFTRPIPCSVVLECSFPSSVVCY